MPKKDIEMAIQWLGMCRDNISGLIKLLKDAHSHGMDINESVRDAVTVDLVGAVQLIEGRLEQQAMSE